jgi:phosphatidylglycerol---prolipoprotein diacylglyceryl transferase
LIAVLAGIIGARLVYAARAPGAFLNNPLNMLALTPQMLDSTGGLLIAAAAALIYATVKHIPLRPALDAVVTLLSVLAVAVGLANFASGSAFGTPTQIPWAISLWGEMRHPTQVYDTLAALLIAAAVWPGSRIARSSQEDHSAGGMRFWAFLALSAGARILLETFRGDSILLLDIFRQAQVIAWVLLALSLWQIGRRLHPSPHASETTQQPVVE